MLQRLVRSIVSTAPRPCLIDDVPWLCSVVGDGVEVAAGKQVLDPPQELRVDRQRVGERAVERTGLLDDDLAVALEDVRLDLADVFLDQRLDRLIAAQDARARFTDAGRAQRIGRARPTELRLRSLAALQQRRRRPLRLEGLRGNLSIEGLKRGPGEPGAESKCCLDRSPHVHAIDLLQELARHAAGDGAGINGEITANYSTPLSAVRPRRSRASASSFARSVFPRSVSGMRSSQTIVRGTLYGASRAAQCARTALTVGASPSATTQARIC